MKTICIKYIYLINIPHHIRTLIFQELSYRHTVLVPVPENVPVLLRREVRKGGRFSANWVRWW
jgi:hypothetical protein